MSTIRELPQEKIKDFIDFFKPLIGNQYGSHANSTIKKLFEWHNEIYPMNQHKSIACGACRNKCFNRCLSYYNSITNGEPKQEPKLVIEEPKRRGPKPKK
jgi:formate hydrogenlyase subunit 6/NADH:ubiquinone oxidoreductase subunit I